MEKRKIAIEKGKFKILHIPRVPEHIETIIWHDLKDMTKHPDVKGLPDDIKEIVLKEIKDVDLIIIRDAKVPGGVV